MDSVYIRNVLNGATEDFRFLIRKYKDLAFSVAVAVVKNEFDAEEVVQESFIKVFQHLKSFRGKSDFKTWFFFVLGTFFGLILNIIVSKMNQPILGLPAQQFSLIIQTLFVIFLLFQIDRFIGLSKKIDNN